METVHKLVQEYEIQFYERNHGCILSITRYQKCTVHSNYIIFGLGKSPFQSTKNYHKNTFVLDKIWVLNIIMAVSHEE